MTFFHDVYSTENINNNLNIDDIKTVELDNGCQLKIRTPNKGSVFLFKKKVPDFVLYIYDLTIKLTTEHYKQYIHQAPLGTGEPFSIGKHVNVIHQKLSYKSFFFLWDNKLRELVEYGHIEASVPVLKNINLTWEGVTKDYVRKIFTKSPFMNTPR